MKTLMYIPRMFTRKEFKELVEKLPEDFERTHEEFWNYVNERLKAVASKIRWVYTDSAFETEVETPIQGESAVIADLIKKGVNVRAAVDPILEAEAGAWLEMTRASSSPVVLEMYDESLSEISKHVVDVVDQTLGDGEIGVLFLNPLLKISFSEEMRVIRLLPFDPQDYLNRQRAKMKK